MFDANDLSVLGFDVAENIPEILSSSLLRKSNFQSLFKYEPFLSGALSSYISKGRDDLALFLCEYFYRESFAYVSQSFERWLKNGGFDPDYRFLALFKDDIRSHEFFCDMSPTESIDVLTTRYVHGDKFCRHELNDITRVELDDDFNEADLTRRIIRNLGSLTLEVLEDSVLCELKKKIPTSTKCETLNNLWFVNALQIEVDKDLYEGALDSCLESLEPETWQILCFYQNDLICDNLRGNLSLLGYRYHVMFRFMDFVKEHRDGAI